METQLCTFRIGDLHCGLELNHIQEIMTSQPMTRVPLAPPTVAGIFNLRGNVVTAVDLRMQLAVPSTIDARSASHVVTVYEGNVVSLLVDEIGDVVEVEREHMEAPPKNLADEARNFVEGVYKLDESLLLALDIAATVRVAPP